MKGNPVTLIGNEVNVGMRAPNCSVTGHNLQPVNLESFKGKVILLVSVPSLDTAVCSTEARKFNEEAEKLGKNVATVVISCDLPFAQARWCAAEGISNLVTLSDYKGHEFGKSYGLLIKEVELLARAVMVVDPAGIIRYEEIVKEVTTEPNYAQALKAAQEQLAILQ